VCPGALVDAHDRRVEQELAEEALLPEVGRAKTGGGQ
jgi:hypothetical protein